MPQYVYFDLMPTELVGELLLYIPKYTLVKEWLELLHFDKFYTILAVLSPFWKKRFKIDISSIVEPPAHLDRNDYLTIYAILDQASLLLVRPIDYLVDHGYDKLLYGYLDDPHEFDYASARALRKGNVSLSNEILQWKKNLFS